MTSGSNHYTAHCCAHSMNFRRRFRSLQDVTGSSSALALRRMFLGYRKLTWWCRREPLVSPMQKKILTILSIILMTFLIFLNFLDQTMPRIHVRPDKNSLQLKLVGWCRRWPLVSPMQKKTLTILSMLTIFLIFKGELLGPKNAEDPSAASQECPSIEEENLYNSQYNVNDILDSFERELLGPDNAEDPSAARQECPSIEGSLGRAAETVSKKQPKRAVKKHSPYRSVKKQRDRWAAQVKDPSKGKYVWIGTFDSPLEAAKAYDAAASRLRGKEAKLNFPDESPPKKSRKTCKFTQYLERYKTCESYKRCKCAQYLKCLTLPKKSGRHVNAHNGSEGMETTVVADCGSEGIKNTIMGVLP